MMNVWPSGDMDEFMTDFGNSIVCDKWIEFHAQRFMNQTPAGMYLGPGVEVPEAAVMDGSKLLNSYGDTMATTLTIWSEKWSEGFELYRATIIVFC